MNVRTSIGTVLTGWTLLACMTATPLSGQEFWAGARAGANLSDRRGGEAGSRTGVVGGVFFSFGLKRNLALRNEVLYSQRGWVDPQGDVSLDYIEVPVLLVYEFPTTRALQLSLDAGVYFGFRVHCEAPGPLGPTGCADLSSELNARDAGAVLGAEAAYRFDASKVILDVRYGFGFTDMNEEPGGQEQTYNEVFEVSLGLAFRVGRR